MTLTKPQQRMLWLFPERDSVQCWKLLLKSGSHSAGYRVLNALIDIRFVECRSQYDSNWYGLTEAGREYRATNGYGVYP